MFPPERRGRPISVYLLGQAIAPGIGLFITSLVLSAAPTGAFDGIPILSSLAPWRIVFFLCRSEEHTSELQSLMRTSYAVFCLKKKKATPYTNYHTHLLGLRNY